MRMHPVAQQCTAAATLPPPQIAVAKQIACVKMRSLYRALGGRCYMKTLFFAHRMHSLVLIPPSASLYFKDRSVSGSGNRHHIPMDRVPAVAMIG